MQPIDGAGSALCLQSIATRAKVMGGGFPKPCGIKIIVCNESGGPPLFTVHKGHPMLLLLLLLLAMLTGLC